MLWGPLAKWGTLVNGTDNEESISAEWPLPARDTRQYDTGEYRNKDQLIVPNTSDRLYPPLSADTKADRGESHRVLRLELLGWRNRLLLPPVSYKEPTDVLAGFELDQQLTGGTFEFKDTVLPSCFYAIELILRYMLTGPKSMLARVDRPGPCNARLMNIWTITPRLVAYAAVQARTMLSKSDWTSQDGSYDYTKLFALVLEIFAEEDLTDWSRETLAWLQSEVFGTLSAPSSSPSNNSNDDDDDDEITVQRRARRAAALAAGPA
ncbi:hypothetical protein C8F01DRAFT_1111242 [Mycena amicta]|nr:hypothetical protein C8F01DRAFT_1111242 [Mycena amicta]